MQKGIIIGAGIAGLTTAVALAKKGIEVKVYEQASEIKEVGAGIWIAPNGLKIYSGLGLADDIKLAGKTLEKIAITDLKNRLLSVIDGHRVQLKHAFKTVAIHRAALQKILYASLPEGNIVFNKRFTSYKQTGEVITADFEDGSEVETDFLIIADGINSNGRLQINSGVDLRYSGQTCWRFVNDFKLPADENGNMYEIWSNKKGLRVGYSHTNENQVYVFITNFEKAGLKDNPETIKEDLLKLCLGFPKIVQRLISAVPANNIIRTDLYDFKPVTNWIDNKVALIGDAAHATTPNLGQGACQAIEDAYVIANELAQGNDIATCFKIYQQKRIKKAAFITNTSWRFAQITNTSGLVKSLIKTLLRMTPDSVTNKQLDKIFSIEY